MELYKALCEISGEGNVLKDEPMKMHTTFRIGGPADYFIQPSKIEEIRRIVAVCRECSTPYYIMGNGSNLLVGDKGFRGVIVQVFKQMSDVYADGERVYAQAGALLSKTAAVACEASLTGMEFASGIPGTLGGSGVLVETKEPETVAETMNRVMQDAEYRGEILKKQDERLKDFAYESIRGQILDEIEKVQQSKIDKVRN
mgnify:CR=1 FL=1